MSQDTINNITGLGNKTQKTLNLHKIITVGDLAQIRPGQIPVSINNLGTLISRAKSYIELREKSIPSVPATFMNITPQGTEMTTNLQIESQKTQDFKALIDTHSWMEQLVVIPDPINPKNLQQAVVCELSIEPSDRISLLCEWCTDDGTDDLCTMTYTPQLLIHFNPTLPVLTVQINPEDWAKMTNGNVLQNVVWETNAMKR